MTDITTIVTPGGYFHYRKRSFVGDFANLLGVVVILSISLLWYLNYSGLAIAFLAILITQILVNAILVSLAVNKKIDPNQIKVIEQDFKNVITEFLKGNLDLSFKECERIALQFESNVEIKIFYLYLCKQNNQKPKIVLENFEDLKEPSKSLFHLI